MKKFHDVLFVAALFVFVLFMFSLLCFEQKEAQRKEKIDAVYNLLNAKGGIARFPELAAIDMESLGGEYSNQGLVSSYRTNKILVTILTSKTFQVYGR